MTKISNPDKVLFPASGFTKADLVGYYEKAAEAMGRHVVGRPLTLHRFPNGIGEKGFLQKNASDFFPDDIERIEVPKQGGTTTYAVLTSPDRIPYLANLGTITFHIWTSAVPNLDQPDRLVFDLDPAEGDAASARAAARVVHGFLSALDVESAVMTTGSKGYHVVSPLLPTLDYEAVGTFAQLASALMVAAQPDLLTGEFRLARRQGKVFVDWLRNRWGQTGVAPWSVRAREGQPVATPIAWDELDETPPRRFDTGTALPRLDIDPIADLAQRPTDLAPAVAAVEAQAATAGIEPATFDRFRS